MSLIRAGASVDAGNRYGVTPLILAATNGNAVVVDALMKAGANANDAMPEGQTVLMAAARTGNVDTINACCAEAPTRTSTNGGSAKPADGRRPRTMPAP